VQNKKKLKRRILILRQSCAVDLVKLAQEFADLRFADFNKKFACPPLIISRGFNSATISVDLNHEFPTLLLKEKLRGKTCDVDNLVKSVSDILT
jgi:hypothetical protein